MTDSSHNPQRAVHRFPNDSERIHAIEDELLSTAKRFGYGKSASFAIRLALDEAIRNAFVHGCCSQPDKQIDVIWAITPEKVMITVNDHGAGFDPRAVPDPTIEANIERPCGRGLLLMRSYMTSIQHNEQGNMVTMCFCPHVQS